MIPMSLKQRIALAIKGKQKAAEQGNPMSYGNSQPLGAPSTMTIPKPDKPIFAQAEKTLSSPFLKLKKKFGKF